MIIYSDLNVPYGGDLSFGPNSDLSIVQDGTGRVKQRIIRILMTNPGDIILHPDWGTGLPAHVGDLSTQDDFDRIQARVELGLSQVPEIRDYSVTVTPITPGFCSVSIDYVDVLTGLDQTVTFGIGR